MEKKYKILSIGIILLIFGLMITISSLILYDTFWNENQVLDRQTILPRETLEGSFTLEESLDMRLSVFSNFAAKPLTVFVHDELNKEIFIKNLTENTEEYLKNLQPGVYRVSVVNLSNHYSGVSVFVSEVNEVGRQSLFFSFVFAIIAGIIMIIIGFIITIISTIKFFRSNREENL